MITNAGNDNNIVVLSSQIPNAEHLSFKPL